MNQKRVAIFNNFYSLNKIRIKYHILWMNAGQATEGTKHKYEQQNRRQNKVQL